MSKKLIIGFGILALIVLWLVVSIYPDWLWFENLTFSSVFWTMLLSKLAFGLAVGLVFILIISLNLYAATRLIPGNGPEMAFKADGGLFSQLGLSSRALNYLFIAFILLISFFIASKGSSQWDMALRFLYQQPFDSTDPIFNRNIGFYVFSLPFYLFVQNWLLVFFILAALLSMGWYLKGGGLQVIGEFTPGEGKPISMPKITIAIKARKHLIFLGGIIVILLAWGYHLKIYNLLYSTQGPAFGASYADVQIKVLAYWVLIIASLGLALILFLNVFKPRMKIIWLSGAEGRS